MAAGEGGFDENESSVLQLLKGAVAVLFDELLDIEEKYPTVSGAAEEPPPVEGSMDVDQAISHLEPPRGPLMACSRTVLPLWAAPASGPLLPASAGPSAHLFPPLLPTSSHLFPPLCLLYLCGLCPWQKKILALTRRVKLGWGCLLVQNGVLTA